MEEVVIMIKDNKTGFLDSELESYEIENNNLIYSVYATKEDTGIYIHLKLTVDKEIEDWEYNAILDYYDTEIYDDVISVKEEEDTFDPIWEVILKFNENKEIMENKLKSICSKHKEELEEVFSEIKDLKSEYE